MTDEEYWKKMYTIEKRYAWYLTGSKQDQFPMGDTTKDLLKDAMEFLGELAKTKLENIKFLEQQFEARKAAQKAQKEREERMASKFFDGDYNK